MEVLHHHLINTSWVSSATLVIKEHGIIINGVSNKTNVTTGDKIKVTANLTDDEGKIMPNTPFTILINNWIYEITADNNGNFYLEHVIGKFPEIIDVFVMFNGNSTHHSALLEIPLFVNNNTKSNKTKENKNSNITKEIKTNKPIEKQEIILKNKLNMLQTNAAMRDMLHYLGIISFNFRNILNL